MKMTYYLLEDDLNLDDRWYLNRLCDTDGVELDSREFCYGRPVDVGSYIAAKSWREGIPIRARPPLKILLDPKRNGRPLDFTFTNANLPIAAPKVAAILRALVSNDVQFIPASVESQLCEHWIINVVSLIDCIDVGRSEIQWYGEGDNIRPDKVGKPEMISRLVIAPDRSGQHHMFRIKGWTVEVVVSNIIKEAFEQEGVTGVRFRRV
jgi:hypothetical protein